MGVMTRPFLICILAAAAASAEVKLPAVISSHMVLQQDLPVRLWGWAEAGEKVTAALGGKSVSAVTASNGAWSMVLPKMKAGGPHTLTIEGKNKIVVDDVLVGEVWVASGQSNMEFAVERALNFDEEKAAATDSQIRFFKVKRDVAGKPASDMEAVWEPVSPNTVGPFSAVAYFFARDLRKARKAPVGILQTSWGGTPAEAWTSRASLEAREPLRHFFPDWDKELTAYPARKAEYDRRLAEWKQEAAAAKQAGREVSRQPQPPRGGPGHPWTPAGLYNAMISPLTPYAIRGAIWYQGEANAGSTERSREYRLLFRTMIEDWRKAWGLGDFSFLFVQLAGFTAAKDADWPLVRESQNASLALRNAGVAVAIDIGEEKDIHPRNKQDVGRRLALAARAITYKEKVEFSGPMYKTMKRHGGAIRLSFTHAKGMKAQSGELGGFLIAGADKKFVPAKAEIKGSTVVVRVGEVKEPAAVRYGWSDWIPAANLSNAAGLPASPFRTDTWPETK